MSEENRPRYKEQIDIGPDMLESTDGAHDSGRSKTNRMSRSKRSKRNGQRADWMPNKS